MNIGKNNLIVTGPKGCGKTEYIYNHFNITEEVCIECLYTLFGFSGLESDDIVLIRGVATQRHAYAVEILLNTKVLTIHSKGLPSKDIEAPQFIVESSFDFHPPGILRLILQ